MDPLFKVLTEGQAERLFAEAFDRWFQSQLENPPEGVRRSLRRPSRAVRPGQEDEDGPVERLRRAAYELAQWRDFRGRLDARNRSIGRRRPHASSSSFIGVAEISAKPSYSGDNLYLDTEPVRRASRDLMEIESRIPNPESRISISSNLGSSTSIATGTSSGDAREADRPMARPSPGHRFSRHATLW